MRLDDLPIPPLEFRKLVGPTEPDAFDNPSGGLVFPDLPTDAYRNVFDFGCGCGRIARQLMQQQLRPERYIGIDRHKGMIEWCQQNLAPRAPTFTFRHHDVRHELLNPGGAPGHLPLPAPDASVTLFIAWSVFTHLLEADAEFYLGELGRILSPSGTAVTTWFLFDKGDYPMMQEFQNALFINPTDLTNAVIFDREWLRDRLGDAGLTMVKIAPPVIRGFQWTIHLQTQDDQRAQVDFPEDRAPRGLARPPAG